MQDPRPEDMTDQRLVESSLSKLDMIYRNEVSATTFALVSEAKTILRCVLIGMEARE